jgi:hypothetical protein
MPLLQKAYLGSTALFADKPWFYDINGTSITGANTNTVNVTSSATAHTKGSWAQLIASTSGASNFFICFLQSVSVAATDTATLLDIGIGASGSETAIASNIAVGGAGNVTIVLPVNIPSGTRIAARIQGVRSSQTLSINQNTFTANISGSAASLFPPSVDVLGTDSATSTGTAMSGASGTWVEIIASTGDDYMGLAVIPSVSDTDTANLPDVRFTLGVGAAGSEVAIGEISASVNVSESVTGRAITNALPIFGREVAAGSRLAIRHNIAANPSKYDACIIAVPKV